MCTKANKFDNERMNDELWAYKLRLADMDELIVKANSRVDYNKDQIYDLKSQIAGFEQMIESRIKSEMNRNSKKILHQWSNSINVNEI